MSFTLYPHQQSFVHDIRLSLAKYRRVIACAATGAGKSKIFISISRAAIEKGKTVLIISESTKIFRQISAELGNATEISSKVKTLNIALAHQLGGINIYVAMSQTLSRRPLMIDQFQALGESLLVITDEVHISTPAKLLAKLDGALHIGFTATPDGRTAKHLGRLYRDCVMGPQPQFLVEKGYLSPYHHFERKVTNLSTLKKGSDGEFTESSQEEMFRKMEVYDGVFEDIKKFPYKKCMIFCSSIKHTL